MKMKTQKKNIEPILYHVEDRMPTGGSLRQNITGPRAYRWAHDMFYFGTAWTPVGMI